MSGDWIKLNREIRSHWIWDNPNYFQWWIDILMMASYQDKRILVGNELIEIERGSFVTSQSKLAERWNADRRTVKKYINLLQDAQMIVQVNVHNKTIVKVRNYGIYQGTDESIATTRCTDECTDECTVQCTSECTSECTGQCTQHKNEKNEKNIYKAQCAGARVIPPTLEDVKAYISANQLIVNAEEFFGAYDPDWLKGDEPIKDWRSLLRGWNRRLLKDRDERTKKPTNRFRNFNERDQSDDYYDELEMQLLGVMKHD